MEVRATAKTLRIPPRKARLVLDLIRGKDVEEAAAICKFTPNAAAAAIAKVLKSAVANAVNNNDMVKRSCTSRLAMQTKALR